MPLHQDKTKLNLQRTLIYFRFSKDHHLMSREGGGNIFREGQLVEYSLDLEAVISRHADGFSIYPMKISEGKEVGKFYQMIETNL